MPIFNLFERKITYRLNTSFVFKKETATSERFNWQILYSIMCSKKFAMNEFEIYQNENYLNANSFSVNSDRNIL